MYVYRFLFNTCTFNVRIFENIVKNLWAIIEDIDENCLSGEKKVAKKPLHSKIGQNERTDIS